ncbi:MAG TPA: glycosyltransferase family 2 protein [Actinomycetales bacterium]|nr:glycosyltransferase family 2 protein [Actinomycetales bacterium]
MRPASLTTCEPVLLGDLDLDTRIPSLTPQSGCDLGQEARLLARLHTRPVGEVRLSVPPQGLGAEEVAASVWEQVGDAVAAHLRGDGQPVPTLLPTAGLARDHDPACLSSRTRLTTSITVVVATRDRTGSLLRTLCSLARVDYPAFDVVVVDSAPSSAETEEALAAKGNWPFALRYAATPVPGLAWAHNTGLTWSNGEIVAFTDDDVEVDRHWLAALAEAFADPEVGCVTGLILPAELQTPAQLWVEQAGGFCRGFERRQFSLRQPPDDTAFPFTAGRFGSGANMAFRTDWLRGAGGFDPATGAGSPARGGDDLHAFLRVILDDGTLVYEPAAVVRHWHRRQYEGLRRQAFGYGVGLGAYLSASVRERPSLLGPMARRTAPALRHLLDSGSVKNKDKEPDFPRELTWLERAGLLAGPFAYGVSRWRYSRLVARS